ncbi:MAG: hypothetical protein MI723_03770 [Caulobacterales bacterium]|nr:hypothetical protein [Caulobacterales bacterium]
MLAEMGYDPGAPDGAAGARTISAANAFAAANGIDSVEFDADFLRALRTAAAGGHRAATP